MRLNDVKYRNFILTDSVEAVYRKIKITIIFNRHTGKFIAVYCDTCTFSVFNRIIEKCKRRYKGGFEKMLDLKHVIIFIAGFVLGELLVLLIKHDWRK